MYIEPSHKWKGRPEDTDYTWWGLSKDDLRLIRQALTSYLGAAAMDERPSDEVQILSRKIKRLTDRIDKKDE